VRLTRKRWADAILRGSIPILASSAIRTRLGIREMGPLVAGCGLLLLVLVVGLIAIADHSNKTARNNHAELLEWYCTHRGTRCGGPSSASIERHWNERQRAYEVVVTVRTREPRRYGDAMTC
jgi:hypothetical protein